MKYEIENRRFLPIPDEEDEVKIHRLQFNRKYWSIERESVDSETANFLHDIRLSYRESSFKLDWTSSIELKGGNIRFQFYSTNVSEYEYLSPDEKGIRTDYSSDIRIIREYIVPLRPEDLPLARFIIQRTERRNEYFEVFGLGFILPSKAMIGGFVNIPLHLLEGQWPELATLTLLPYEPKFISIYGLEQCEDGVFRVKYAHREDEFKKEIRRYIREHKNRYQRVVVDGEEFIFPIFLHEKYADVNGTAFPIKKQGTVFVLDQDRKWDVRSVESLCLCR